MSTSRTFEYSEEKKQKDALVQQHNAQKPGDFSYSMQAGWDDIMNQILNRGKFSYDLNGDALYQQYKDQYTTQGKMAMMDTMGKAQAATGGYGNSYAQSVGQQAYQGYLQQLNDKVPELYQLALDQYNREGEDLYNKYALHADKYAQEYGKHRDAATDWQTERGYLTEDARYTGENEYKMYRDGVSNEQWKQTFDEGVRQFNESIKARESTNDSTKETEYKKIEIGSTAYKTILDELATVETYEDLLAFTNKYIGLKYDPDEIEALTGDLAKKLKPDAPGKPNTGGGYMSGGNGGRFSATAMK